MCSYVRQRREDTLAAANTAYRHLGAWHMAVSGGSRAKRRRGREAARIASSIMEGGQQSRRGREGRASCSPACLLGNKCYFIMMAGAKRRKGKEKRRRHLTLSLSAAHAPDIFYLFS